MAAEADRKDKYVITNFHSGVVIHKGDHSCFDVINIRHHFGLWALQQLDLLVCKYLHCLIPTQGPRLANDNSYQDKQILPCISTIQNGRFDKAPYILVPV